MNRITEDEISSIIKERVDNFELAQTAEHPEHTKRHKVIIVGCGHDRPYGLQAAVIAAHAHGLGVKIVRCDNDNKILGTRGELIISDEYEYYINNSHNIHELIEEQRLYLPNDIDKKENHPYGWYRKFEKKRF